MILCLPLVSVLVIAGFEVKSGEATTMYGQYGTVVFRANHSAINRLTNRATIPDIAVSSFTSSTICQCTGVALWLGHLICTLRGS